MFVESALCYGGLISMHKVIFYLPWIFKLPLPEVWRFVTPFLLTGPRFSFVFDLYFSEYMPSTFSSSAVVTSYSQRGHTVPAWNSTRHALVSPETSSPMLFL